MGGSSPRAIQTAPFAYGTSEQILLIRQFRITTLDLHTGPGFRVFNGARAMPTTWLRAAMMAPLNCGISVHPTLFTQFGRLQKTKRLYVSYGKTMTKTKELNIS